MQMFSAALSMIQSAKIETGPGLTCSFLIRQLLEEADLDESGSLSYVDFEKVMDRAPEFMK